MPKSINMINEPYLEAQTEVAKLVHDIYLAIQRKDIAWLESVHHFGPKFTKFEGVGPGSRLDGDATKIQERDIFSAISDYTYKIQNLKVDVFDSVAIATMLLDYGLTLNNQNHKGVFRGTIVFIHTENKWLITHEHFSPYVP